MKSCPALSARLRTLPPAFYDAAGSDLFDQITETPEYYPTRTERAILKKYSGEIIRQAATISRWWNLARAAPAKPGGNLKALLRRTARAISIPCDVSSSALQGAAENFERPLPRLRVTPIVADYTHQIPDLNALPDANWCSSSVPPSAILSPTNNGIPERACTNPAARRRSSHRL